MTDEDARDIGIHGAIDQLVRNIMSANGFDRARAIGYLIGFAENDEISPVYTTAPGRVRKTRTPKARYEVRA